MADSERFRVGLIGFGVGKLYAAALRAVRSYYPDLPPVDLVAVATATSASGERAQRHFGFERRTTDYRDLLAEEDLNVVIIATPPSEHRPMLIEALRAGKAVYADKPLARDLAEGRQIVAEARRLKRDAQMIFEFRHCPALQQAREMLRQGDLGRLYAFRGAYFRSSYADPDRPLRWKGLKAVSGAGSLNDTGPHLIDLLGWLVGFPERVAAQTRTFIPERPRAKGSADTAAVETDDHVLIQAALPSGAIGSLESGRLIAGAVNDLSLEVYGSLGSLRWSLMDPNFLEVAERGDGEGRAGWRRLPTVQRYPGAALPDWDVPVGMMRFHIASLADFLRRTQQGLPYDPGLEQGLRVQAVVEAAGLSAEQGAWVDVPTG